MCGGVCSFCSHIHVEMDGGDVMSGTVLIRSTWLHHTIRMTSFTRRDRNKTAAIYIVQLMRHLKTLVINQR